MSTKFDATVEAVENADKWMGGAVVLDLGNGEFRAYPGAVLNDISFTEEYDEIAVDIRGGLSQTGYSIVEVGDAESIAELLLS